MLNSINLDDKTYQDLFSEALTKIPLYSSEWTNFNRSDPGITILQNLSSFTLLQRGSLNRITEEVQRGLLRLAGYYTRENHAAHLFAQAPGEALSLPPQYQLRIGDICFETEQETVLSPWTIEAVYVWQNNAYHDVTMLLDTENGAASIFGTNPEPGNALYCILDGVPETGTPLLLWAQASGQSHRVPFPKEDAPVFARTKWQYYTADGWKDAVAQDDTHGFLVSGKISLVLGSGDPVPFTDVPSSGCAFRCVLESCEYDWAPRLESLSANLFPLRQCETRAASYLLPGDSEVSILSPLAELGNLYVFCRETPDAPYRAYFPFTGVAQVGRFYLREEIPGGIRLSFHRARFGFAPCEQEDAVLVCCFDDEMIHHRDLGPVFGYEDQEVTLDIVKNVLPGNFLLLSEEPGIDGLPEYSLIPPGVDNGDGLFYRVDPKEGKLLITHPGFGAGSHLYLAACTTTCGVKGNIRAGSILTHPMPEFSTEPPKTFRAASPGFGGFSYESVEQLRSRLAADVRTPSTAVLPEDYEFLVLKTPGLCLHKVHATASPRENLVRITAKPYSNDAFPSLSPLYLEEIHKWLEPRRMLTTRIEIVQPNYVAVDVWAILHSKSYYGNALDSVSQMLTASLDYINGPQPFGSKISFSKLYQKLLELPAVESIVEFKLIPQSWNGISLDAPDLILDPYTLCYPGEFHIQFQTSPHLSGS